jgi:excisionase family DNA binding protein
MQVVVIDIDQLKTIINDAVSAAMKQNITSEPPVEIMRKVEVAKELKVSVKTIGEWMKEGKLPYHRIKSRVFFRRSEVIEAMQIPRKYKRA